jgi:competence protein ComEA
MTNLPIKQSLYLILFGVLIGLLAGGVIWITSSQPRGVPVILSTRSPDQLLTVYISGEIANPGIYQIPLGSRVNDVVNIAGGFLPDANVSLINLAELVSDSSHIKIPALSMNSDQSGVIVNINTASEFELAGLPGIGPSAAKSIVTYRTENGPFKSIEEIQKVSGVGPATFEKIKQLITVGD